MTVSVPCGPGTYYDDASDRCHSCPPGTNQLQQAQTSCQWTTTDDDTWLRTNRRPTPSAAPSKQPKNTPVIFASLYFGAKNYLFIVLVSLLTFFGGGGKVADLTFFGVQIVKNSGHSRTQHSGTCCWKISTTYVQSDAIWKPSEPYATFLEFVTFWEISWITAPRSLTPWIHIEGQMKLGNSHWTSHWQL